MKFPTFFSFIGISMILVATGFELFALIADEMFVIFMGAGILLDVVGIIFIRWGND